MITAPSSTLGIAQAMKRLLDDQEFSSQLRATAAEWARSRYSITELVHVNLDFWSRIRDA